MIATERLVASALGELDEEADAEVEEHVLSCDRCAALYAAFLRIGSAVASLVASGKARMPVTRAMIDRLTAEGLVTRRYQLAPGGMVPCTVDADDIYSLTTLEADLSGVERVDLMSGSERVPDVTFDERAGRVHLLTSADLLRTLPTMRLPLRLIAVGADGSERTVAEYTLDHTAFVAPM